MAERAFDLMVIRAKERTAFGGAISDQGVVQDWIAEARWRLEQARLLVLRTAWQPDTVGNRPHGEISLPSRSWPLTLPCGCWTTPSRSTVVLVSLKTLPGPHDALARTLRIADGPDEVEALDALEALIARRFDEAE